MTKKQKQHQAEAIEALRKILKPGDVVHTILRNVSRSGMSRQIAVIAPGMKDITYQVAAACDFRMNERGDGLKIGGCGSDMGFEIVYNLGRKLFPDGFGDKSEGGIRPRTREEAERLVEADKTSFYGRNGDTSGWDNDGGYALKHRWL